MTSVTLQAVLGEDRQLHITVPDEMPTGPVEVRVSRVQPVAIGQPGTELTREQARAILAAAGVLSTARFTPADAARLTPAEEEELGRLFSGEPDMATLISQGRDEPWD